MDTALALEIAEIQRHSIINKTIAKGGSDVQKFYSGAVVFITGGSGFLGKQLIEKLFRSCDIKKVYMLLRTKKNKSIAERKKIIEEDSVFESLRKTQPDFAQKIFPILGDVQKPNLGIDPDDWNILTEEVTMIFHGAATINFVEPLRVAVLTNIRGTMETIKLGKECKNLKSYVHVSTAYSHALPERVKKDVPEKFFDCPVPPDVMLRLVEELDDKKLDAITPDLIKDWPNTYAFTKAIAEEVVRTMSGDLPICIVRPAIVIAACREPSPGWIDKSCAFGPSGFVLGTGLGVMRVLYCDGESNLDLVPVDLTNNAIIVAAYETVSRKNRGETDIQIYTVTGTRNPLTLNRLAELLKASRDLATDKAVWYSQSFMTKISFLYLLATWILHYIPGYFVDSILRILGKKPLLIKVYDKVYKLNRVLGYFMTNYWIFGDTNLMKLYWSLSNSDRIIYNCNMATVDWHHYIRLWCLGIRKYIIQDGLDKTHIGVKKQFWLRPVNAIFYVLYIAFVYKVVYYFYYVIFFVATTILSLFNVM